MKSVMLGQYLWFMFVPTYVAFVTRERATNQTSLKPYLVETVLNRNVNSNVRRYLEWARET